MSLSLRTQALVKRFSGLLVTDSVDLDIRPGELHAIIGPNGAGKTTLMNQLCGELRSDSGTVLLGDEDVSSVPVHRRVHLGLLRSYQISSIFEAFTALENAALAAMARATTPSAVGGRSPRAMSYASVLSGRWTRWVCVK